ncbi:MAG TPA: CHASE3 domain-containing protein [Pirellulales bacterium]|jgi:PAS domain S-box-containing protein|nr:CHASE3 domain-containing protein [Pirellulales bacterium]
MSWSIGRGPQIGFLAVLAALVFDAVIAYRNLNVLHDSDRLVAHTHQVLTVLAEMLSSAQDAETRQRGYIITGREAYRTPFEEAINATYQHLAKLKELTSDNPRQQDRIHELEPLLKSRLDDLANTVAIRREQGYEAAAEQVSALGPLPMDAVRVLVAAMQGEEYQLLEQRSKQANDSYSIAVGANVFAMLLTVGVIAFAWRSLALELDARRAAEMAAHGERERLLTTLTSIGDGVIVTDLHARVILQNPVSEQLTGWGHEAVGQPVTKIFRIVNETSRKEVENPVTRVLRDGMIVGLANHTVLVAKDGSERPIDDSGAPVRDKHGTLVGTVLVFRDITERRQAEEVQREADARKDQFLAMLAHELRNPLAPISNALQLWGIVKDDPAQMEELRQMMERQVHQMIRLIDDLLDLSRITRGKIQLRKQRVEIGTLVRGAIEAIDPLVQRCGHELVVTPSADPVYVQVDVARMVQVFGNILHNAAKYTGRNGKIWITTAREADEAVVRIRDNGPGIPEPMLPRIFDMFIQVDQTLDRSHGGLGIGLTLVKTLVEAHQGTVIARSEGLGHGSEFIVRLPALVASKSEDSGEVPIVGSRRSDRVPSHRILVVDDVQASAKTLAMMLRSIGQEVDTRCDGPSALEAVAENDYGVIFLDIAMPGMDGYEVARQIRQRDGDRLTLVALTGYGQEQDRQQAMAAGFNHHLVKPTSIETLEHLLETIKPRATHPA